jgi:hypothetical protein
VIVPVDAISGARAAAFDLPVSYHHGCPTVIITCSPTDRLAVVAADHAPATMEGQTIVLDLSDGLRQLIDCTPPLPPAVPGPCQSPLWPRPAIEPVFVGPVHLSATSDVGELPSVVLSWLELVEPANGEQLSELDGKWREQAHRMLENAVAVAEALPETLTPDERQGVVRRLDFLAHAVRHGRDGGRGEEPDLITDATGKLIPRPVHSIVNSAYRDLLTACAGVTSAESDRSNSEDIQNELKFIAHRFHDDLPERFKKAHDLGLLGSMLGASRHELLDVVWIGWRCLTEGEELRELFNPSMHALNALERARAVDDNERRWTHDRVTLRWLAPAKRPVLVSSFLGRIIISEYELEEGEAR